MFEALKEVASQVDQDPKTGTEEREYLNVQIMTVGKNYNLKNREHASFLYQCPSQKGCMLGRFHQTSKDSV